MTDPTELRTRLEALAGTLDESFEAALAIDADFVAAYVDLVEVPERTWRLDAKTRALIMVATTSAVTTLDREGLRTAVGQAKRAGASQEEVLEAVHLCAVLGIHSYVIGVSPLAEVAEGHGQKLVDDGELDEDRAKVRDDFTTQRGYWSPMNETLLRTDAAWFQAYTAYSSHPWLHGVLSPKVRELIYIAIDLACTHLFDAGVKPHIENALRYGATVEEIVEVLAVIAPLGFASVRVAAPMVREIFGEA
jgi:alkylhydroperoxidase/carboxymuconolactone decarboxylase family protein YurZ